MKSLSNYFVIAINIAAVFFVFLFVRANNHLNVSNQNNLALKDSVEKYTAQSAYLNGIIRANETKPGIFNLMDLHFFKLENSKKTPINFANTFDDRNILVIRYTEIGCNACVDSTFKVLNEIKSVRKIFRTIILIDFNNYDYYLKWRKITEPVDEVFWVEKGTIPLEAERSSNSYLFTVNRESKTGFVFIPNSKQTPFLRKYLRSLVVNQ